MTINPTEPFMPELHNLLPYLQQAWNERQLSNHGSLVQRLEHEIGTTLGISPVIAVSSGTSALILAMAALDLEGEVITTPFSFVATAHAIRWLNLTPVFVDIDPRSMTLAPAAIEKAITPRTSAVLAVNVYGHPCDFESIKAIADRHRLKVIYDSAHAFGVGDSHGSILRHGDASILSFHATKVFHTVEGGGIVARDARVIERCKRMRNFGLDSHGIAQELGLNAKLNELQAAVGLYNLTTLDACTQRRRDVHELYDSLLTGIEGLTLPPFPSAWTRNYAYYPILVEPSFRVNRSELIGILRQHSIVARPYFAPLLTDMPPYARSSADTRDHLPVARHVSERILCLPMHPNLTLDQVRDVCTVIALAKAKR